MRLEAVGQRSETVRRANLSAIVRELHAGGPASRSELVARTGLTRSAIRALIGELSAADLVSEERAEPQGVPGPALPRRQPQSARRGRAGARDRGRLDRRGHRRARRRGVRTDPDRSPQRPHLGRGDRRGPRRTGGRAALAATRRRAAGRRRRGGRRRRPAERRVRVQRAQPRLARRAAGCRARRRARCCGPDLGGQRRGPRRPGRAPAWRRHRLPAHVVHLRRVRRRRRGDRRRPAVDRGGGLRRRGRDTCRSTRAGRRAAVARSAAGRPRSARRRCCAWPADRRVAVAARSTRC